jgi:hypothetical protein
MAVVKLAGESENRLNVSSAAQPLPSNEISTIDAAMYANKATATAPVHPEMKGSRRARLSADSRNGDMFLAAIRCVAWTGLCSLRRQSGICERRPKNAPGGHDWTGIHRLRRHGETAVTVGTGSKAWAFHGDTGDCAAAVGTSAA